jgi:hypothetical protein
MTSIELHLSSTLATSAAEVWRVVSTMAGVNDELWPFVRMTFPESIVSLDAELIVPGAVVFRSWLLAGGVIPFDRHALALVSVQAGSGFVEQSSSWLQRSWRHERMVTPHGSGCVVTDRLMIVPRVGLTRPLAAPVVRNLFEHRHRRLARRFGTYP